MLNDYIEIIVPATPYQLEKFTGGEVYDEYENYYRFWIYYMQVILEKYEFRGKNKRQRKWRVIEDYNRVALRSDSSIPNEEDVYLPPVVKRDAVEKAQELIKFVPWKDAIR